MKIRKDDKVKVIAGKSLNKTGNVLRVYKDENKVLVEGVNKVTKHVKPGEVSEEGGIIEIEKPIDASNVMVICDECGEPTRVGYKVSGEKKFRVCKKCGEVLDK